eukprot:6212637-Pleurochrysis_carterae.AAC.3
MVDGYRSSEGTYEVVITCNRGRILAPPSLPSPPSAPSCKSTVDLMLVLDGSGSIGSSGPDVQDVARQASMQRRIPAYLWSSRLISTHLVLRDEKRAAAGVQREGGDRGCKRGGGWARPSSVCTYTRISMCVSMTVDHAKHIDTGRTLHMVHTLHQKAQPRLSLLTASGTATECEMHSEFVTQMHAQSFGDDVYRYSRASSSSSAFRLHIVKPPRPFYTFE